MVYALYWLYSDSLDFKDGVNDLNVGTNESIFFSLVWRKTPENAWIVIECWLNAKIVNESDLRANDGFFGLMIVFSRNCPPLNANESTASNI